MNKNEFMAGAVRDCSSLLLMVADEIYILRRDAVMNNDDINLQDIFSNGKPRGNGSSRESSLEDIYSHDPGSRERTSWDIYSQDRYSRNSHQRGESPRDLSSKKKVPKKKKGLKIFIAVVLVLAVLIVVGLFAFTKWMSGKIDHKDIDQSDGVLGISAAYKDSSVTNIALFGIDARGGDKGRSDAVMVLTLDGKRNKVKMTSLMRDSFVKVEGHDSTKLCHAYAYGGAPLAIKTINQNYNLNIKDYVTVNFDSLAQVIDAVGGVTVNVSEAERKDANHNIQEYADIYQKTPTLIDKSGEQLLDGMQAVGYARIRNVGNSDYERTERQRRVLQEVFDKALKMGPTEYPKMLSVILPQLETSLNGNDFMKIGFSVMRCGSSRIEQERFPLDEDINHKNSTINGVSYVVSDLSVTSAKLDRYIFDDIKP